MAMKHSTPKRKTSNPRITVLVCRGGESAIAGTVTDVIRARPPRMTPVIASPSSGPYSERNNSTTGGGGAGGGLGMSVSGSMRLSSLGAAVAVAWRIAICLLVALLGFGLVGSRGWVDDALCLPGVVGGREVGWGF